MILKLPAELLHNIATRATGPFAERQRMAELAELVSRNFKNQKPDVVLLDLSMPDMISIEAAQQMTTANPSVPLILFT
jgi:CheY-like chemotaxis protein